MADYLIKDTTLTNIADAIRAKKSSTDKYTPAEMTTAIASIESGGGAWYVTLTPNDDGSITADKTMAEIEEAYQAGYAVYCIYLFAFIFAVIPIIAPLTIHRANEQYVFCGVGTVDKLYSFQFELKKSGWTASQKEIPQGKIPTIVTSVSASSTNDEVPSAKAVYTFVTQKVGEIENGTY